MQTVTIILVDHSGSMKDNSKIDFAKKLLIEDILPELDYSFMVGIKTFSTVEEGKDIIHPIHPLSLTNRSEITQKISSIENPNGGTPISAAIKDTVKDLKEFLAYEKRIILVTDGEETTKDGITYENVIAEAGREGFYCQVHIIGLDLNKTALEKANAISIATKGSVSNIPFTNGTPVQQHKTKEAITPFINAVKPPMFSNVPGNRNGDDPGTDISQLTPDNIPEQGKNGHTTKEENTTDPVPVPIAPMTTTPDEIQSSEQIYPVVDLIDGVLPEAPPETPDISPTPNQVDSVATAAPSEPQQVTPVYMPEEKTDTRSPFSITITSRFFNDILVQMEHLTREMADIKAMMFQKTLRVEPTILSKEEEDFVQNLLNKRYGERVQVRDKSVFTIVLEGQPTPEYFIICKSINTVVSPFCLSQQEWRLFLNYTKNTQVCLVMEESDQPKCFFIDNLLDWILKGKVVPYMLDEQNVQPGEVWLRIEH